MKTHTLYSPYITWTILIGVLGLYIATCGMMLYFALRFHMDAFALDTLLSVPLIIIAVELHRHKFSLRRFLLHCVFSSYGICCKGFLWKQFVIAWKDIRFYGMEHSLPNSDTWLIYFSCAPIAPREKADIIVVDRSHLVFEYRDSLWADMAPYVPPEMRKNLEWAIRQKKAYWGTI